MRVRSITIAGLAALLALLAFRDCVAQGPLPSRVTWEYKIVDGYELSELGSGQWESGLNKLGGDGWELVGVDPAIPKPSAVTARDPNAQAPLYVLRPAVFFFKRPLKP